MVLLGPRLGHMRDENLFQNHVDRDRKGRCMQMPEARRHFAALIERPQGEFRLAEAALYLAQEEYPEMSRST